MRTRFLWVLLFFASALAAEAQNPTLTVFFRENDASGAPMANVRITAPGANPAVSDSSGKLTLIFPDRQIGDDLELAIYQEGYALVNHLQRFVTLRRDPNFEANFYLCRPARCEEERIRYYGLSLEPKRQRIESRFSKRISELESQGRADAVELARVRGERDQGLATIDLLIKELAQAKPDEDSATYRGALHLLSEGQSAEALRELDAAKLERERKTIEDRQAGELERFSRNYLLRGQILMSELRFEEAEKAFEEAKVVAPGSLQVSSVLAFFWDRQNEFAKAKSEYQRGLKLARERGDRSRTAEFLINLGRLSPPDDARSGYEEALRIYRELEAEDPESYKTEIALTLQNLGVLHHHQKRLSEAFAAWDEALRICGGPTAQEEACLSVVGMTLGNLGAFHLEQKRSGEARTAFEGALGAFRKLAANHSNVYLPGLALAFANLGTLYNELEMKDLAVDAYREALRIYRDLAAANSEAYLPMLAAILDNFGIVLRDQNRMDEAQTHFEEALLSFGQLADRDPQIYLSKVARTFDNLGDLFGHQEKIASALSAYEEALRIFRFLAAGYPEAYLPAVGETLNSIGILHGKLQRASEGRAALEEALSIRRNLAARDPATYLPEVAMTLHNLGHIFSDGHQNAMARAAYEEAAQILRELVAGDPERFLESLAKSLETLGSFELSTSNLEVSSEAMQEALAARKRLATIRPPGDRRAIARTAGALAANLCIGGKDAEAAAMAREALAILDSLAPAERSSLEWMVEALRPLASSGSCRQVRGHPLPGRASGFQTGARNQGVKR